MTPRERAAAVFQGRVPDQVPLFLDISHWYKANERVPFDLSGLKEVDQRLVALHQRLDAVAYVEMGSFYDLMLDGDEVSDRAWTERGVFHHEIRTPHGTLHERREFADVSYSYNIRDRLLKSVDDFEAVKCVMDRYRAVPRYERYRAWQEAHAERAFIYMPLPYSGLGYLMSRNLGVEKTVYAIADAPAATAEVVEAVNAANLRILDTIIDGPFDVLFITDNMDGNVQTPELYDRYSRRYYTEVAKRLHQRGKYLAVHVDGEMDGCLRSLRESGVDCIDAATPAPMFRLTPSAARRQAGGEMILSGGIPPTVFSSTASDVAFDDAVRAWLLLKSESPRLILAAGDQVPPDAPWERIARLPELVDRYGRYA